MMLYPLDTRIGCGSRYPRNILGMEETPSSGRIPVAIVDDHVPVRDGFRRHVEHGGRYEVVIMADDGEDHIRQS